MTIPFEMKVEDVFRFANGTTLFLGTITSEAKFIGACDCEIIVDGKARLSAYVSEVYRDLSNSGELVQMRIEFDVA